MGLGHSPRIVTDGLVLALDAGNVKSNSEIDIRWNNIIADATTVSSVGVITCLSVVHTGNRFFGIDYVADCTQGGTKTFDNRPPSVANMNTILDNMANCKEYQTGTYNSTGAVFGAYPDAFHACTLRFTGFGVGAVIGIGGYFTNTDRQCRLTGDLANSPVTITSPSGGFVDPIVLTSDPADIQFGNYETTGSDPWYIYWIGSYNQVPYIIRDNPGYVNGATYSSDDGGSLSFDGTDDYVTFSSSQIAPGTGAFTWNFWAKHIPTAETGPGTNSILLSGTGSNTAYGVVSMDSRTYGVVYYAQGYRIADYDTSFNDEWWHIAFVGNGGVSGSRTLKLYRNGVQAGSTYTYDYNFTSTTPYIGRNHSYAPEVMRGFMANATYYNRELTASEIQQNYNALRGRYGI